MVQAPLFAVLYQFPCCLAERGAPRANFSLHHKPKLSVLLGQSLQKYAKIRITNDKAMAKPYFGGSVSHYLLFNLFWSVFMALFSVMSWEVLLSSDGDGQAGNGNSHQFSEGLFKIGSFCETGKRVVHQVTLFKSQ